LIYFGFTNCPDICPEELDKMGQAVEMVDAARKERVLPMFISVDPARDGVKEVKKYIMGESPCVARPVGERYR
jgi:protein SCO1/2